MKTFLLPLLLAVILSAACRSSKSSNTTIAPAIPVTDTTTAFPLISDSARSLMELPQTQDGGFVLQPGYFETAFKTYCLQPGTPDPRPGDAYLQGPITGKRSDIVESVLLNSRTQPAIPQRNIQLLLWSIVSGADFNRLSRDVRNDAMKLLTPSQIFELKGGVGGLLKNISRNPGLVHGDMKKLFEIGSSSYEAYEKIAVLQEPSRVIRNDVKYDQWYKQPDNYYIRYLPMSYQQVKIQVYVPDGLLDTANKVKGEYLVFDPTGLQAIPAFTNAQRLGIGAPVKEIIRVIIQVNQRKPVPVKKPKKSSVPQPKNPKEVSNAE